MKPLVVPPHIKQRADDLVRRLQSRNRDQSTEVVNTALSRIVNVGGQVSGSVVQMAGDVIGVASASVVAKLRGRLISVVAPTVGQALVWNGTEWAPTTVLARNGARWEPLTNGDPDAPELIFENGDVLMDLVE